jgi:cobalt/nickel transport system permease protein
MKSESNTGLIVVYAFAGVVIAVSATKVLTGIIIFFFSSMVSVLYFKIPFKNFKKIVLMIPFGGFIALFQPFTKGEHVIISLSFIHIYAEGLDFGLLLLSRLVASFSFIVLVSSLHEHEILAAMRWLRLPTQFIFMLSLTVRYLKEFYTMLNVLKNSITCRGFSLKAKMPYKRKIRIVSYLMGSLVVSSIERGERTYEAMASRGYSVSSKIFMREFNINIRELSLTVLLISCVSLIRLLELL